jgi:hypothetical protein
MTIRLILLFSALVFASPAAAGQNTCNDSSEVKCGEVSESRCREMNESMLQIMKSAALDKPKDMERNRELIVKVEKMLADNRRRDADECRSWIDFNRIIVHQ